MPSFPDLAALNYWLEQRCVALWSEIPHAALPGSVADVWAAERSALMPLPPAFDGFVEHSKRVSPTCLISFERDRYSVPASFANRPVSLPARQGPDGLSYHFKFRAWLLSRRATCADLVAVGIADIGVMVVAVGGTGAGLAFVHAAIGQPCSVKRGQRFE